MKSPKRKPPANAGQPRARMTPPKAYSKRIQVMVEALVEGGAGEEGIAKSIGISLAKLQEWATKHADLRAVLEDREALRRWDEERTMRVAEELAAHGASTAEVSEALGVTPKTVRLWLRTKPHFKAALDKGKDKRVAVAENTLFDLACGYHYEEDRHLATKEGIVKVKETKFMPPDKTMLLRFLALEAPEKHAVKPGTGGTDAATEFAEKLQEAGVGMPGAVDEDEG